MTETITDLFEFPLQEPMKSKNNWSILDADGFLVLKAKNETKIKALHIALNTFAQITNKIPKRTNI